MSDTDAEQNKAKYDTAVPLISSTLISDFRVVSVGIQRFELTIELVSDDMLVVFPSNVGDMPLAVCIRHYETPQKDEHSDQVVALVADHSIALAVIEGIALAQTQRRRDGSPV